MNTAAKSESENTSPGAQRAIIDLVIAARNALVALERHAWSSQCVDHDEGWFEDFPNEDVMEASEELAIALEPFATRIEDGNR